MSWRVLRACVLLVIGVSGSLATSSGAWAAETSAPSGTEAGPEEQRFRRREQPPLSPEPSPPVIDDRTLSPPEPTAGVAEPLVTVRTIRVEPTRLLSPEQIQPLVAPFEGRQLTLADLRRLTTQLTQQLRQAGYVTSRAYLPPQEVAEGVVTIRVLEGRVGALRVEGARHVRPEVLTRRMRTRPEEVVRYQTLQRDLAQLNANPDRRVTAVLLPGAQPGATDVLLQVKERWPWHAGYLSHNAGTAYTGRIRQGLRVGHGNLTGRDDQLVVRAEWSERSDFAGVTTNYLLPLGEGGRTVGLDVSRVDVELGRQFRVRNVAGNATVVGLTWAEPLWQGDAWELEWATGLDWKRIRSREVGSVQGKDDLRVLRLGPNVLEEDAWGRSILTTEVGIGFDRVLGGSHKTDPAASRSESGGQFTRVTLSGGRLHRVIGGLQVLARGVWQMTDFRLPPSEALRLGGAETVRGYPEGEFLGDYGYHGALELRVPLVDFAAPRRLLPRRPTAPLTLVGFVDGGAGFLRDPLPSEEHKRRLLGVGFGGRLTLSPHMTALVDVGFPVGDTSVEEDHVRLYYALAYGF